MENVPDDPQKPKGSPLIALLLGFTPAAILIAVFGGMGINLPSSDQNMFLWLACIISIVCCFVSSALLLRRGTSAAIAGGFLLMFLNAFIAFFFGCCASVNF